ncbi:MAG: alkaline phosphatase D family protein [Verrucomicrobiota bacterium]
MKPSHHCSFLQTCLSILVILFICGCQSQESGPKPITKAHKLPDQPAPKEDESVVTTPQEALDALEKEEKTEKAPESPDDEMEDEIERAQLPATDAKLTRIAVGSCNRPTLPQPLWEVIQGMAPDLWIWMGDNVYADTEDPEEMKETYEAQLANPSYRDFISRIPVIGTWDDHDFGANDSGKDYPMREMSQQMALDFLGEAKTSPRRRQEGIYTSYTFGPEGKRVKIILLDTRYHREEKGPESDVLGEMQWSWLGNELKKSKADVHLLISSIQLLQPVPSKRMERWINFPSARLRLMTMIREFRPANLVVLSGDRHFSEISRAGLKSAPYRLATDGETHEAKMVKNQTEPTLYELTASGLTHTWENFPGEENPLRIHGPYTGIHFGLLELDWGKDRITLKTINEDGKAVLSQRISFDR